MFATTQVEATDPWPRPRTGCARPGRRGRKSARRSRAGQVDVQRLVGRGRLADGRMATGTEDTGKGGGDPARPVEQGGDEVARKTFVDEFVDQVIVGFDAAGAFDRERRRVRVSRRSDAGRFRAMIFVER